MKITAEQIDRANSVNLPDFLMSQGFRLKKSGSEYVWQDHDSLYIKNNGVGEHGKWYRFSTQTGGDNIDFVREFMGRNFVEAVELLNGERYDRDISYNAPVESKPKKTDKADISIEENPDSKRLFAYLCQTRGLDFKLVSGLVREGKIAQEFKTGNVIFKITDENNKLVGAEKVGTSTHRKFKGIAAGTANGYGFEVCRGKGENLMFFESAIDMLSYVQMNDPDNHRLVSMMGVKPAIVIDTMERYGISPENVFLCSDNDIAGNEFADRLIDEYPSMKRIIPENIYKDWNDMLRKIPVDKTEENNKMITYGNRIWNDATDNKDKSLISMSDENFKNLYDRLENSGINYLAYSKDGTTVMAVNDMNIDWLKQIIGNENVSIRKSSIVHTPPDKNIIGNTEYRYIPQKEYVSADRDTALKMAELMQKQDIKFSGRIYPNGKAALTVSRTDLERVKAVQQTVIDMRKQFEPKENEKETTREIIGNTAYRDIRQRQYIFSKMSPEQYQAIKPFLDENARYSGVIRGGKITFTVEKDDSANFNALLENAENILENEKNTAEVKKSANKSSIHFGLFGNGVTAYDVSRTDKETNDYVTVAHISPEGIVKIYDKSISAEDLARIEQESLSLREDFIENFNSLDTASQLKKLYDRADAKTMVNMNNDNISIEEKIEKYMPFIFFGEGERPYPVKTESALTVDDLSVGDIIMFDGKRREVEELSEKGIMLKDLDADKEIDPVFKSLLVGTSDVYSYNGWKEDINAKGFEIISKADPVSEKKESEIVTMRKVGDFYEMYGENAVIAANVLDLTLMSKNGDDMVGFPDSVKDDYSEKLKNAGYTVLMEDVFELDPPKRDVPEKNADLMSDISEVAENVPEETVNPLTIVFNGDSDSLNKIKDKALSLGATCTLIASGLVVDTYENHRDELLLAAGELGLESKIRGEETPDISADDDTPLFTDADVIEEIINSENASENKPFWAEPFEQGEQLGLFDDTVPKKSEDISAENTDETTFDPLGQKSETAETVMTVYHGTTADFDKFKPDYRGAVWTAADFNDAKRYAGNLEESKVLEVTARLENPAHLQYGISENWDIDKSIFDAKADGHDSAIIDFKFTSAENDFYKFSLENSPDAPAKKILNTIVDAMGAAAFVPDNETISEFDKRMRENDNIIHSYVAVFDVDKLEIADKISVYEKSEHEEIKQADSKTENEKDEAEINDTSNSTFVPLGQKLKDENENPNIHTFNIGDKFRNNKTGEISEVISLTGALPWQTDDCTVSRVSGGFEITENIPYDKLMNRDLYEFIGNDEKNIEQTEQENNSSTQNVSEFKDKTNKKFSPIGDVDANDIETEVMEYVNNILAENNINANITGIAVTGSRSRGIETDNSDIDVVIEVNSDIKEYALFNILNENEYTINGVKVDINPIRPEETGTLDSYLANAEIYLNDKSESKVSVENNEKSKEFIPVTNDIADSTSVPLGQKSENENNSPDKEENFTITDDALGEGGAKTKFKNNIAAIETLKTLEKENRPATAEEKVILSKYVGWGGVYSAFDSKNSSWEKEFAQLKELLTDSEYRSASASTLDAFYTTPTVIDGIYKALEQFGFKGGNVLEPAMGVGNFFGRMPENMRSNSSLYGIEIDSISGRIAQKLYPNADIGIHGFEKNKFQDGCFDVAVGNVPFGELGFNDIEHGTSKLHDYFFAETLDKIKSGGIVAFVTSAGTLDKKNETVRKKLAEKADLIGAVRLPGGKDGAFKQNANTEVTTDIIFLQKRSEPRDLEQDMPDWVHIGNTADGLPVNQYFADNPDMVLGKIVEGNKLYNGRSDGTMCVPFEDSDLKELLNNAVSKLSAAISDEKTKDVYEKSADGKVIEIPENLRNYSFFEQDKKIYFKRSNSYCDFCYDSKNAQYKRIKAFIELRDTTRELIEAQELNKSDEVIKELQTKLNTAYDTFYEKFGLIHSQTNKRYFSNDVSYNLVAGLEKEYEKNELKEKSDIFTKRTICPPKAVEHVESAIEALTLSIAEKAKVDFEYMSALTGMTESELKKDLTGEIFKVPHTENEYQTASEYLSGDIRVKLKTAEEIAEYDSDFNVNVNALKAAMPPPLKAGDIDIKIGATWLDPKYYEQFMYEVFKTPNENKNGAFHTPWQKNKVITAEFSEHTNSWYISNKNSDRSVMATQTYGSKSMNAYDIMEHLLNLNDPVIYKTIEVPDGFGETKEKRVVDADATKVVQRKADKIKAEFKKWIFKDSTRREEIVNKYNELFNSIKPREYDGAALKFPMMNSDIKLHDHQKNAIAHAMFGGNTLFAHSVGAGKSATRS